MRIKTVIISNYNTLFSTGQAIGLIRMLRDSYLHNTAHSSFAPDFNSLDCVMLF